MVTRTRRRGRKDGEEKKRKGARTQGRKDGEEKTEKKKTQRRKDAKKTGESKPKRTFSRCLPTCNPEFNPLPSPFLFSSLRLCVFAPLRFFLGLPCALAFSSS
jgi:hypothetical protein